MGETDHLEARVTGEYMTRLLDDPSSLDEDQTVYSFSEVTETSDRELDLIERQLKNEGYTRTSTLSARVSIGRESADINLGSDRLSRGDKLRIYPVIRENLVEWRIINEGSNAIYKKGDNINKLKGTTVVEDGDIFVMYGDKEKIAIAVEMKVVFKGKYLVLGIKEDLSLNRPIREANQ